MLNFCFSTFQLGLHLLNSCANSPALTSTQISVSQNNFKMFYFWNNLSFFFFFNQLRFGIQISVNQNNFKMFSFLNNRNFSFVFSTDFVLGFKFQWIKTTSRVALKKIDLSHNNFKSYVWYYNSMSKSTVRFITVWNCCIQNCSNYILVIKSNNISNLSKNILVGPRNF